MIESNVHHTRQPAYYYKNVATPNHNPPRPRVVATRHTRPHRGDPSRHRPGLPSPTILPSPRRRRMCRRAKPAHYGGGGALASCGHGVSGGHSSSLLRLRWCAAKASGELSCICDMRRRLRLHSLIWALGLGGSWLPAGRLLLCVMVSLLPCLHHWAAARRPRHGDSAFLLPEVVGQFRPGVWWGGGLGIPHRVPTGVQAMTRSG
jgi:hypothetical protein